MNRLTRLLTPLNSPRSHPFVLPYLSRDLTYRTSSAISPLPKKPTHSPHATRPILFSHRRRTPTPLPVMEASGSNPPDSDTSLPEDFVHVQNPNLDVQQNPVPESEISQNPSPKHSSSSSEESIASGRDGYSANAESGGFEGRRVLPEELSKSVVVLECESSAEGGSCDVYLVGTAHVSQESCREVQAVISCLNPQVVFLELCASRVAILTPQDLQVPTMSEMIDMWKTKKMNAFGILYSWFLAKVANKLEVLPGAEFRVAFEEARSYGAKVILGDRPVQITLRRTWGKMNLWHKAKFVYYMLFQAMFLPSPEDLNKMLKEMDDVDMLTLVIQEMSKAFPTLMETLLHERDMYMSSTLLKVAREHSSVVAVVGKGHISGIKKHWKQPIEVKDLLEMPAAKSDLSAMKIMASVGLAVTGIAIISGIYLAGKR